MRPPRLIGPAGRQGRDLASVIGNEAVIALCKALGGTKIYVPAKVGAHHPLSAAIGLKAATRLAQTFCGLMIDIPKAHARRERVLELARSGAMTIAEAALACDYTERRVYQLLAESREDGRQLDMFAATRNAA